MKNKLLLINVVDADPSNVFGLHLGISRINGYEPVALGIIASMTPDTWEIEIIDENVRKFLYTPASFVAISALTASINRAYEISHIYKTYNTPVIIGGVHATLFPEEIIKYADVACVGEAEFVWKKILSDFENNLLKPIYYSPITHQFIDIFPNREKYGHNYHIATIQVSRGCPNKCKFCNVPVTNRHIYKKKKLETIINELKSIQQHYFVFVDDNFVGYSPDHIDFIKALLNQIIYEKIEKEWMCFTTLDVANNDEILELASKSGCRLVYVGIESEVLDSLKLVDKKTNYIFVKNKYKQVIKKFHKFNIAVAGGFMCGFDTDTESSILLRKRFIFYSSIDSFTYTFCTPLPKTELYYELEIENRLLRKNFPEDWKYYNLSSVTFVPKNGTAEEFFKVYFREVINLHKISVFTIKFFRTWLNTNLRTAVTTFIFLRHNHIFLKESNVLSLIERLYRKYHKFP